MNSPNDESPVLNYCRVAFQIFFNCFFLNILSRGWCKVVLKVFIIRVGTPPAKSSSPQKIAFWKNVLQSPHSIHESFCKNFKFYINFHEM